MKTTFTIEADTAAMIVTLRIQQGRLRWEKHFGTVTKAALYLVDGIGKVMDKQAATLRTGIEIENDIRRAIEEDLADQTAREAWQEKGNG